MADEHTRQLESAPSPPGTDEVSGEFDADDKKLARGWDATDTQPGELDVGDRTMLNASGDDTYMDDGEGVLPDFRCKVSEVFVNPLA